MIYLKKILQIIYSLVENISIKSENSGGKLTTGRYRKNKNVNKMN